MAKNDVIYCTYFDKGFLLKGLALHASLIKSNPDAKLWVLAFDKYTEQILKRMNLKGVTVVALSDFEDKELLAVKNTRHPVEYYWTCTPSWVLYIMKKLPSAKQVVYIDGDIFFYSNPDTGVVEIGDKSILTVEHRFPPGREILVKDSGRFNVAFNVFRNDKTGIACLQRWRKQCLDWCYWKHEDGKLGDQMYLDEWPKLYGTDLVISKNVGVDAAPWNISQYKITQSGDTVYINRDKLVCYHFHQFQILGSSRFSRVLGYTLSRDTVKYIYEPYEEEITKQYRLVKKVDDNFKIEETENDKVMLFRERLARYFGPVYWRIKSLLGN
jgi:hypothetical protein